ncbi:glycosyltransferase family 25 protein [Stenomitos frigidus]|uniref:LPS biosynthesis glycosyltransferase n=1 Tax=Stenomitos frigidus ULC18 TaxID=2107698 RepID=A0A2T1E5Q7_9CYAN|nr:glycosyltransferase family 25 protein [Stenomitos frigidus]PSB28079.1 LPS biosynthesis glycosyltransferase [Stenomitos frigidus ULC18]
MQIKDYVDRIYAINLPSRRDRRQILLQEMESAGLPLTPSKIEIFPAIRPDTAAGFPGIGVYGCFLSHLAILKQARAEGLANVLILEDDVSIDDRFVAVQRVLVEQLQQAAWDFVYFGHIEALADVSSQASLQPYSGRVLMTHFYAVNARIFDRLIAFLEAAEHRPAGHPDGGPMYIDGAYSFFRERNPDVVTLLASPSLGWQRSSRSDLTPGWVDRTPILTQFADLVRAGKVWVENQQRRRKKLSTQ